MLSAIVLAPFDAAAPRAPEAVARSLSVLVGAAVADLVRDATIAGPPGLRLATIADHAGCGLVEESDPARALEAALGMARSENVFVLKAGFAHTLGFIDEVGDWLLAAVPRAAALRRDPSRFVERLFPDLAPVVGIVASRSHCLAARATDAAGLARALRAAPLRTRARILV